jgi:hypothetical protein
VPFDSPATRAGRSSRSPTRGRRRSTRRAGARSARRWAAPRGVLGPRAAAARWRYVAELPRDAQGKTPHAALVELLEQAGERAPVLAPLVLSERRGPRSLERELRVPADLAFLGATSPDSPSSRGSCRSTG